MTTEPSLTEPSLTTEGIAELDHDRASAANQSIEVVLRTDVRRAGTQRQPHPAQNGEIDRQRRDDRWQGGAADR